MKHHLSIAIVAVLVVAGLAAQSPQGWKLRIDRSTSASDPDAAGSIQFAQTASGFHATNPQAATFWNPSNTASGNYTLKGTFTLMKPSSHTNYYGLVFGGSGIEGPDQSYIYFMVAQDGTWLVKRRNRDATQDMTSKTPSSSVKRPDSAGKSANALEVRVVADKVDYAVNGTVVHTMPRTGALAKTDGVYGIRVNHQLEVQVEGFSVSNQ